MLLRRVRGNAAAELQDALDSEERRARRVRQEIQKQIWHEEQNYTKKPITEIEVMGVLAMLSD